MGVPRHNPDMDSTAPTPPQIFDRLQVKARLARARAAGPVDFLLQRAVEDLGDRLTGIKRDFVDALDLATPLPLAAEALVQPGRHLTRASTLNEAAHSDWASVVVDEEALPFAPQSFDLCVSLFALQSVNDLPGVMVQIRQLLRPDGLFIGCLLGGQSLQELRAAFAQAESEVSGGASPRVAPFADIRDLGGLLQRTGFALPVTDVDTLCVRYANPFALFQELRMMGASNALVERDRRFMRRAVLLRAAEIYQELYSDADGRVRATFEILWVSGWAPHESQQKPLKPGSAKMRLADALGVVEGKLPDAQ